jgi:hypothetical protein
VSTTRRVGCGKWMDVKGREAGCTNMKKRQRLFEV